MENDRLLHLFGLARRSGRLVRGFDAVETAMRNSAVQEVYLAADVSERTARHIRFAANETGCIVRLLPATMAEIGHATGSKPTGVLSLTDSGFVAAIRKLLPDRQMDDTEE